jgi:2-hydroxychromene-2-carboxylate isomerase
MRECERRAAELGLPLCCPMGWPSENWSITVVRGALVAGDHGRLREFSAAAFRHGLGEGRDLRGIDAVTAVAEEADVPPAAIREGVRDPAVKARLKAATDAAIVRGVRRDTHRCRWRRAVLGRGPPPPCCGCLRGSQAARGDCPVANDV